ncbi:hypothetical protein K1X45_01955 [Pseudochrobactrum sp. Wa41.01b-1]|uniref:hypothetical protein n=1 Tax=Pseudochrobactrum sp. Wa41.01b-1 TaxID=2864102 RepID=UPI001C69400D|nr:hypothetical protein [Pseudochrobactrum sp. Wa41.01b-1]QYM73236.1 hypothetical protein K1X45_01955 [Pseudochrobactrum sp. Wa41.01b-1]
MTNQKSNNVKREEMSNIITIFSLLFFAMLLWFAKDYFANIFKIDSTLLFLFGMFTVLMMYLVYIRNTIPLDEDEVLRASADEIENTERRILSSAESMIQSAIEEKLNNKNILSPTIKEIVNEDLILSIDHSLRERITTEAKPMRLLSYMDKTTSEMRIRLEAAGHREERQAARARTYAFIAAYTGIFFAIIRVGLSLIDKTTLLPLFNIISPNFSVWPYILSSAAPWVGVILVCEFTAILLFKDSNGCSRRQRYFSEAYVELRDRHMALRTIIEYGTPEQITASARSMIIYNAHTNEAVKDTETISASARFIESLTGLFKETADKLGSK